MAMLNSARMTIKPEQFAETMNKIMDEYGDQATFAIERAVVKTARTGRKMLNAAASSTIHGRRGKYEKSWRSETKVYRLGAEATLYSTQPGLPHLLEHGHAITYLGGVRAKGPGRASAYPHIAKVDEQLADLFPLEIEKEISKI